MPTIDVSGTAMHYAAEGAGDPLVLVHGGFLDSRMWVFATPLFAERFSVFAVDWPGHGESGGRFGPALDVEGAIDYVVDHLIGFLERLDVGPSHVVGQSAGGGFLLHVADRRPDLVWTMSLHEPTIVALLDDEFASGRQRQIRAVELLRAGQIDEGLEVFVESVGGDWALMPEPFKDVFRTNAHNYVGKNFEDPAAALTLPAGLARFPMPVQFTRGSRSPRFFHASIDRVAALIPHTEIAIIDGGGHAAMLEHPVEYVAAVVDFIDRVHADEATTSPQPR